jgi:hypothetical protein
LPDASEGSFTQWDFGVADGSREFAGHDLSEEVQERAGREAQSPDFVGQPDADGSSAPRSAMAIAAKDATRPEGFSGRVGVVEPGE